MEAEDLWDRMDVDDPSNLRLAVEINRRIPIVRRQREEPPTMPNYEGRRSNYRSVYGWAPGSDDEDDDFHHGEESDDDQIQPFLHTVSGRNTSSSRRRRNDPTGRTPPIIGGDGSGGEGGQFRSSPISAMEALLQSARRQPRVPRNRILESYLLDRYTGRSSDELEDTERTGASSSSRAYRYRPSHRGDAHRVLTHGDLRARALAHRQLHTTTSGESNSPLKDTIIYLERLRYSNSFEESISTAASSGLITIDNFSWRDSDFILDTTTIAPPAPCSWLRPGAVFSGCQRAANAGCSVLSRGSTSPQSNDPVIVNGSDSARINVQTTSGRRYTANARDENWPVRVTIHAIDYEEMTLSGTMEAYNIPDKTSPSHDAHIVTFLEGEIIDFNKHTLETANFKADADIDSTYWRELQPFKYMAEADISRKLLSRKWITEEFAKGWILMRWKGESRCLSSVSTISHLTHARAMLHHPNRFASGTHHFRVLLYFPPS